MCSSPPTSSPTALSHKHVFSCPVLPLNPRETSVFPISVQCMHIMLLCLSEIEYEEYLFIQYVLFTSNSTCRFFFVFFLLSLVLLAEIFGHFMEMSGWFSSSHTFDGSSLSLFISRMAFRIIITLLITILVPCLSTVNGECCKVQAGLTNKTIVHYIKRYIWVYCWVGSKSFFSSAKHPCLVLPGQLVV